jgi:AhpD family alkylhydroperoxidase
VGTVLLKDKALSRIQKEQIILIVAAARQNTYCVTAHCKILSSLGKSESQLDQLLSDYHRAGLSAADVALLDFPLKLSYHAPSVHSGDIEALRACGLDDESILEAIQVTALARFLCTLTVAWAPSRISYLARSLRVSSLRRARQALRVRSPRSLTQQANVVHNLVHVWPRMA